ncbi:MAG: hypothetical protein HZA32_11785 [Opitutae bacterium]|nr:hypothetical protein [Opitutae bacterium]
MKKLHRFILGLVTSLLLSAGFVRAAEVTSGTPAVIQSPAPLLPDLPCEVTSCNIL